MGTDRCPRPQADKGITFVAKADGLGMDQTLYLSGSDLSDEYGVLRFCQQGVEIGLGFRLRNDLSR
jgi:hypothetical protein